MHMHMYTFTRADKCTNVCVYMYAACISICYAFYVYITAGLKEHLWTHEQNLHSHSLQAGRQMDR
jgi:hypothetical protein